MSVAIGASAAGARAYTATASQGLLYMAEALYNASGLGLPIVMTVANRAIGAPINIWNDHSDSMSQRDSGLDPALRGVKPGGGRPARPGVPAGRGAFAAGDGLHGRVRAHPRLRAARAARRQEQVDGFLPPYEPRQLLDPAEPVTIGALVGPEAFTEVKYLAHHKQMQALDLIPELSGIFEGEFGRVSGGLVRAYRHTMPTLSSSRSARCSAPSRMSSMSCASRGSGSAAWASRRSGRGPARRFARLSPERAGSWCWSGLCRSGIGGIVSQNVHGALEGTDVRISHGDRRPRRHGRSPRHRCTACSRTPAPTGCPSTTFLDLNRELVERELQRTLQTRRSGPHAENMLRDLGTVAAGPV